jgi:hypothetical protein
MLSGALLGCRTPPLLGGTAVTRPAPAVAPFIRPDIEAAHALHARSPGCARLIGAVYHDLVAELVQTLSAALAA